MARTRLLLGPKALRGAGTGGEMRKGGRAAEESKEELRSELQGSDLVFVTAGCPPPPASGLRPATRRLCASGSGHHL